MGACKHLRHTRNNSPVTAQLTNQSRSVVFLGTAHDNGGTSILASNLATAMRRQGHHVEEWYLFGSDGDLPPGGRVFVSGKRSRSPLVLLGLLARVFRALRRQKPDVLYGLQPVSNILAGVLGGLAGIRHRVPTYHGPREWVTPLFMTLDDVVNWFGFYTEKIACARNVADSLGRKDMAIVVNGHDVPKIFPHAEARAALGLPPDSIVLGQIGRLSHQKNQGFSLELMMRLPDARLVLVGIGPDEAELRARIAGSGLADRVRIIPSIAHDRIGLFYSAVDLVLFPSRYEGLSLAAIEAIHAGVPPLCSDIASFRELFAGSQLLAAKLLLPLSDQPAWLERIRDVLSNQGSSKEIGAELARLSPAYRFDVMAEQYQRLVDQWDAPPQRALREAIHSGA